MRDAVLAITSQSTPAPCRVLPYLHATPILFFNLMRFKVTKIATCCRAACEKRAGEMNWTCRGRQRQADKVRQRETQTIASVLVTIMSLNVVGTYLLYHITQYCFYTLTGYTITLWCFKSFAIQGGNQSYCFPSPVSLRMQIQFKQSLSIRKKK